MPHDLLGFCRRKGTLHIKKKSLIILGQSTSKTSHIEHVLLLKLNVGEAEVIMHVQHNFLWSWNSLRIKLTILI